MVRDTRTPATPPDDRAWLLLAAALLVAGMCLNFWVHPLYLEEPRRAVIAQELVHNGDLLAPTQLGESYYRKPPLYNWVLIASARLLGGFNELALRLPTVLSTLAIAALTFVTARRFAGPQLASLAALGFLTSGAILFYFSLLAEIDLFFALLVYAMILALYLGGRTGGYAWAFPLVYLLGAAATLTKGAPGVLATGLSVLAALGYRRDWGRLFGPAHLSGVALYLLLIGAYLWAYAQSHSLPHYLAEMWGQSSGRTVIGTGAGPLLLHLLAFPLDLLKNTLPGSLLLVFALRRDAWRVLRANDFVLFAFVLLLVNLLPYWLSPGARQRYVYMLYPLFFIVLSQFAVHTGALRWPARTLLKWAGVVLLVTLAGLAIGLNFHSAAEAEPLLPLWTGLATLAFLILAWQVYRGRHSTIALVFVAAAVARLLFDVTVLPHRDRDSGAQRDRDAGLRLAQASGPRPLLLWGERRPDFTTVFYLNRARGEPLQRVRGPVGDLPGDHLVLTHAAQAAKLSGYRSLLEVESRGQGFELLAPH